jgi:hypothetical protein
VFLIPKHPSGNIIPIKLGTCSIYDRNIRNRYTLFVP